VLAHCYPLVYVQYILDAVSLLDQYIRAHVVYINDKGIKVTHPVKTAVHYLQTSFMVDFFSWFPLELIVAPMLPTPLSLEQQRVVALLKLNRFLQLYKVRKLHYCLSSPLFL